MIVLIDNYDSFTYNLYQYLGEFEEDIRVYRNDKISVQEVMNMKPDHIVISPGPGRPDDAGICMSLIQVAAGKIPILGVCLGHQCIGQVFGGKVIHAKTIFHGKSSIIHHSGEGIFYGLDNPLKIARYHSLAVDFKTLPSCFEIMARTDDGEVMAIKHQDFQVVGLQFHPESVLTESGKKMIENFIGVKQNQLLIS